MDQRAVNGSALVLIMEGKNIPGDVFVSEPKAGHSRDPRQGKG